jgi:hypothetical protein
MREPTSLKDFFVILSEEELIRFRHRLTRAGNSILAGILAAELRKRGTDFEEPNLKVVRIHSP